MSYITINEAAKILGVNKRTLMRWDKDKIFPAQREPISNIRYYDKAIVEKTARWFDLRKRDMEHIRKLPAINNKRSKFIPTAPLDPLNPPKGHSLEEMSQVYKEFNDWKEKYDALQEEYVEFTEDYYRKLEQYRRSEK